MAYTIGAAIDHVVTSPTVDLVTADTAGEVIVPRATKNHVVAVAARDIVVPAQGVNELTLGRGRVPNRVIRSSISIIRQSRHGLRAAQIVKIVSPIEVLERLLNTGTRRRGSVSGNQQLVIGDRVIRIARSRLQTVQRERHPRRRYFLDDLLELGTPEGDLFPARAGLLANQLEGTRTSGLLGSRKKRDRHTVTGLETELINRRLRHRERHRGATGGADNDHTTRRLQRLKYVFVLLTGLNIGI